MAVEIIILVKPNSSKNEIQLRDDEIHISITAVPDKGKANTAVIKLLAKTLGVSTMSITIRSGLTSRTKAVVIENLTMAEIMKKLE